MELIEIRSNDVLRRTHATVESLTSFWSQVHQKNLRNIAKIVLSMFGSTYCCEQTFSVMNAVKSKIRNSLTTQHTSELIKAAVTSYSPQFEVIAKEGQVHPSH